MIPPGKSWMVFAAVVATLLVGFGVEGMQARPVNLLYVARPHSNRMHHTLSSIPWPVERLSRKVQPKTMLRGTEM